MGGELVEPLFSLSPGWLYGGLFMLFTFITFFGVMNVLTAVFVESAMLVASHERDLLVHEKELQRKLYVEHLRAMFEQTDSDQSGSITFDEFESLFDNPRMNALLDALEINAVDAQGFFSLLDTDDSGAIDIEEFCDGCLRLKGDAKSFDINCLMHENRKLTQRIKTMMYRSEAQNAGIRREMRKSHSDLNNRLVSLREKPTD